MNNRVQQKRNLIYFGCWSRKSFALFAAIGKEVKIAALAIGMCQCAFLKSALNGSIVNHDQECTKELYKTKGQKIALIYGNITSLIDVFYIIGLPYHLSKERNRL